MTWGRVRVNVGDEATTGDLVVDGDLRVGSSTSPVHALHVTGTALANDSGWDSSGDLAIWALGSEEGAAERFGVGYKHSTGMIMSVFKSGGSGTFGATSHDAMTILDTSGNVGIGTSNPAHPLVVNGVVNVGTNLSFVASPAYIQTTDGGNAIGIWNDGATVLMHNTSNRLATSATGVTVTGTVIATAFTGTASVATNVTVVADGTDSARYPVFVGSTSGDLGAMTDAGIAYNPSTNTLTTTTFSGALSGNADTATTAATVTTNAQSAITSVGTLSGLTVGGNIAVTGTVDSRDVAADGTKLDGVASSANNYSHPTGAGNKHIPSDGSSGQFLKYSSSGTAVWAADNNTTYSVGDGGLTTKDFTTTLKNKLDLIEPSATADQTAAEIRSLVGSAADSNVYTDSESAKVAVAAWEAGATADQTAAEIRSLVGSATDSNVYTDTESAKVSVAAWEAGATADQTAAEIRALVASATDSQVFTDADHVKLDGIADGAQNNSAGTLTGLNVDSGVLYVDTTNNRVGVGNTSPDYALDVVGTGRCTDDWLVAGSQNTFAAEDPPTASGDYARWFESYGVEYLVISDSRRSGKENETTDLGDFTVGLIDQLVVTKFNRKNVAVGNMSPTAGPEEIGLISDDVDLVSEFLTNHGTDVDGNVKLGGIDETGWLSLLTLTVQDIRTRLAALEA